jgi:hypothetical protein
MHLGGYGCLDPVLGDTQTLYAAIDEFAVAFGQGGPHFRIGEAPEVVVVPAVGEIALLHPLVTRLMQTVITQFITGIWADKVEPYPDGATRYRIDRPTFPRRLSGKRVLVVVDFMNSMHTARELIREVRRLGGRVVGVCAIVYNSDTGVSAEALDVPVFMGLCPFGYPVWTPEECLESGPCAKRVPIAVDPALGHGGQFLADRPDWPNQATVELLAV